MANVAVIGAQWGDEGKGKVVDWLASRADIVVRFQGGHNAGHTLVVGNETYKLSLLPSGLVRGKLGIIGNGVVIDPEALLAEIERVMDEPVSEQELAKAIKQTRAQFAYSSESVTDQGYWLGASEIVADVNWFESFMDRLAQVTVADVQRVAQERFKPSLRNVGWYLPTGNGNNGAAEAIAEVVEGAEEVAGD
jgi:hypothetical protein